MTEKANGVTLETIAYPADGSNDGQNDFGGMT